MANLSNIPEELRSQQRWIAWKREGEKKEPRIVRKLASGRLVLGTPASSTNAKTWVSFADATEAVEKGLADGVGYALGEGNVVAIDLDHCVTDGKVSPEAEGIVTRLDSYSEVSQSGCGIHILVQGTKPTDRCRRGGVEIYAHGRFIYLTGDVWQGRDKIIENQEALDWLCSETFGEVEAQVAPVSVDELVLDPDAKPPQEALEALLEDEGFKMVWEHRRRNLKTPSDWDWCLVNYAIEAGWSDQNAADLVIAFRRKWEDEDGQAKSIRKDYLPRTIAKARELVGEKDKKRPSVATRLLRLAKDIELFHTPTDMPYAVIKRGDHTETWSLWSKGIRDYLARCYYEEIKGVPQSQAIKDALNVLKGDALFAGREEPVYTRLASHNGKIYLDLCNSDWSAVEITAEGWQVIQSPPIHFVRSRGMTYLPIPQRGGKIDALRNLMNVSDTGWPLILAWLVGALIPEGPYPVLIFTGEQGCAKSTVERMIRSLVDPSTTPLRSLPRDERDLAIAAGNSWIIALDNVSYLPPWLSDAVCRLTSGGGFATRELHTDADEVLFAATRPVMLNGIGDVATRSDLLDRAIIVTLPTIPNDKRRTESDLWKEFEMVRPMMLGLLLDAVSLALRDVDVVRLDGMPRMADFAKWVVAAISALGVDPKDFLDVYRENIQEIHHLALESAPTAREIMILAGDLPDGGEWVGTATKLLEELSAEAGDIAQRRRNWPKNARSLGAILNRLAPNLRAIGVDITMTHGKERLIYIRKGVQDYITPTRRKKLCTVTRLKGGGYRIQVRL